MVKYWCNKALCAALSVVSLTGVAFAQSVPSAGQFIEPWFIQMPVASDIQSELEIFYFRSSATSTVDYWAAYSPDENCIQVASGRIGGAQTTGSHYLLQHLTLLGGLINAGIGSDSVTLKSSLNPIPVPNSLLIPVKTIGAPQQSYPPFVTGPHVEVLVRESQIQGSDCAPCGLTGGLGC